MAKFRCSKCDPSCNLEIRGYNDLPTGCPCSNASAQRAEWKVVTAKKATKATKKAKITPAKKSENPVKKFLFSI